MKRILFIVPYFGVPHAWFDLWLKTASRNKTVDFWFLTDIGPEAFAQAGENIRIDYMSFPQFRDRVQKNFPFEITLDQPYKLCDFRPAFGEIFQPELQGYDFWGHCDIDMLFGDIRSFITEDVLARYDRIKPWGCFSLYRNSEAMRKLYRMQGSYPEMNYSQVFQSSESFAFDEFTGIYTKMLRSGARFYNGGNDAGPVEDRFWFCERRNRPETRFVLEWLDGRLFQVTVETRARKELCYVHFFRRELAVRRAGGEEVFAVYPNEILAGSPLPPEAFSIRDQPLYAARYWLGRWRKRRYPILRYFQRMKWYRDNHRLNVQLEKRMGMP